MPDYSMSYTGEDLDETIANYLNIKTNNNSINTLLATPSTSAYFLRGDNTWSNSIVGNITATKFIGNLQGNADTATALATAGGTGLFYRGDKTWSNQLEGNLDILGTWFDASKADNDVSAITYPTSFNVLDKRGLICARLEAVIDPNGNISSYWYIRNYDTSGTNVGQKGIKMTMNKSGTFTYNISDIASFRSAIAAPESGNQSVGTHDANAMTTNGLFYYTSNGPATSLGANTNDGAIYSQAYNTTWVALIAQDYRTGSLFVRGKNNGTWLAWYGIPNMIVESFPALLPVNRTNNWIKIGTANASYGILPSLAGASGAGHNYIGTSSWYWQYSYVQTAYAVSHAASSSILVKENVSTINDNDAKKLLQIRPVKFDYKEEFGGQKDLYGVIAEEVELILPSLVIQPPEYEEEDYEMHKNDVKSIDYGKFTPHLIKLCQIQLEEIEVLKERVNLLEQGR